MKIIPDVTPEIARKRAQFKYIRIKLCKVEVRHRLLFHATLIFTYNGQTKLFRDSSEAETTKKKVVLQLKLERTVSECILLLYYY